MRGLTADRKVGYAIACSVLAILLLMLLIPLDYVRWTLAVVLLLIAATTGFVVKKRSILSFYNRQVALILLMLAAVYLILYYLTGLSFGYGVGYQELSLASFLTFILPLALSLVAMEALRSVMLAQGSKLVSVLIYFAGVVADLLMAGGIQGISSSYRLADLIGMTLLPAVTANLMYHYMSRRYGMLPCLAYRMPLALYMYIIPFIPDAPQVLPAFALMILPLIAYLFIDVLYEKKRKFSRVKKSVWTYIVTAIVVILLALFVLLVSCQFRFGILVIASPSMTPEINRGDAVVFEAYEHCDTAKENDVIVFLKDSTRVVHRIVETTTVDGQRRYVTKGDYNESPDMGYVTDAQIVGVVRFKVLYIGYPSLWLRDIFS